MLILQADVFMPSTLELIQNYIILKCIAVVVNPAVQDKKKIKKNKEFG